MHASIEDLKNGWFEIHLSVKPEEIEILISRLILLKNTSYKHFHIQSDFSGPGGIGDIEFDLQGKDQENNMAISGFAISPNR